MEFEPALVIEEWGMILDFFENSFGKRPSEMEPILLLIGVQELGQGPKKFSKRQKEELMHIATCRLMSEMGFYELEGLDQDGWPHWNAVKAIPAYTTLEQEFLLKQLIIHYFQELE